MATPRFPSSDATVTARGADTPEVLARFEGELELVEIIGRQVARSIGSAVELDDLRSFGREGLLDAARKFDTERGVPFRAYANFRVRGAMIDGVRAMSQLPRRTHERLNGLTASLRASEGAADDSFSSPVTSTRAQADQALADHLAAMATALAVGLIAPTRLGEAGERVQVTTDDNPEEAVVRAQLLSAVAEAIEALPEEEASLVRRHYLEGERFDQVAASLGLSKSWASRLHTRAMQKLAKRFRERA
ncbi:MAG: polymerase sigma factor for flagellar operon [Polyangiaceae bacterium]|jgi:RNA polymerase sigma factor for flagellar operon FliA|nr:polymerase sigma factor for flagellar operon [Polyangiaceae bacterium]